MSHQAQGGGTSILPCLGVESVENELAFLEAVFRAEIHLAQRNQNGEMLRGEARIGDASIMVIRAEKDLPTGPGMVYVWSEDIEADYERALQAGASVVARPTDRANGIREACFKDPQNQTWWIAQRIRRLSTKEVERRLAEQRRARS